MPKYHVVAVWEVSGAFDVEADSVEEAKELADNLPLEDGEPEYNGGWEVIWVGERQADNTLKVVEEH